MTTPRQFVYGPMSRRLWQFIGGIILAAFGILLWHSLTMSTASESRGQEVYASHDCTDCHLSLPILLQKRAKNEVGLIRVRKQVNEYIAFLQSDKRHESFTQITDRDRQDLIEFLKTLSP